MNNLVKWMVVLIASAAAFFVLSLAGGLVIKFTPMPEKWGFALIVFFMSLVCFTAGIYAGYLSGKAGILTGTATATAAMLIIYLAACQMFSAGINLTGLLKLPYVIPVISGTVGGIIGSNIKK